MPVQPHQADLLSSFSELKNLFEKAGFKNENKFGLLRKAVMERFDVAQCTMYRSPMTFDGLKRSMQDVFKWKRSIPCRWKHEPSIFLNAKQVLSRLTSGKEHEKQETKLNALADQMVHLSLMMKHRQMEPDTPEAPNCSFYKTAGHYATICSFHTHRSTPCTKCGKVGNGAENW